MEADYRWLREKGNVDDRKERGGAERDERERKTFARFINFTGTRQLFKLHRADRPRLSLISPIYLLPCLTGLSPRNPLRDRRDGTRDLPEKKRNDSIATIKFLGAPFSDRMTMVVRAITVVKNFPERLVIERTGFLAQYIHIRRGKPFVRFEPSFLPTLCNVPSLCRDKRNETCVKFVDRSERRSSFNSPLKTRSSSYIFTIRTCVKSRVFNPRLYTIFVFLLTMGEATISEQPTKKYTMKVWNLGRILYEGGFGFEILVRHTCAPPRYIHGHQFPSFRIYMGS